MTRIYLHDLLKKKGKTRVVIVFILINIITILFPLILFKHLYHSEEKIIKETIESIYHYQKEFIKNGNIHLLKKDGINEIEIVEVQLKNTELFDMNNKKLLVDDGSVIKLLEDRTDFIGNAEDGYFHFASFTKTQKGYTVVKYRNKHLSSISDDYMFLTNIVILCSVMFSSIFVGILIYIKNKFTAEIETLQKEIEDKQLEVRTLTKHITKQNEIEQLKSEKNMIEKELDDKITYTNHLSNVICGINHEVSPWLGGIENIAVRLKNSNHPEDVIKDKLTKIIYACDQAQDVLKMLSMDIKTLQEYGVVETNLKETITSWTKVALMDRFIKDYVDKRNIHIHEESLNFNVKHSPMLLSQVILNLFTNSVEHNFEKLENLLITIKGDPYKKMIIYEDNGIGIPSDKLKEIFSAGITSKKEDTSQHGFGLSSCVQYCYTMGAILWAEESDKGAKFCIKFEEDPHQKTTNVERISTTKREIRKKISYDLIQEIEKQREIGQRSKQRRTIDPKGRKDIDS